MTQDSSDQKRQPGKSAGGGVQIVTVPEDAQGQRVDNYLRRFLPGVPKSRIYRLLRTGQVRINGGRAKPMAKLSAGDQVRIPPVRIDATGPVRPPDDFLARVQAALIYDDGDILVFNKPSGMAVHSGSGVPFGVADALSAVFGSARLVHRLDRPTSGCLMAARQRSTLVRLQADLKQGRVEKHYLTLLRGQWRGGARELVDQLARGKDQDGTQDRRVRVSEEGKRAAALFAPLGVTALASLMRVTLHTGRTHQIRVQAAHAGHPVAGDGRYGDGEFNRQLVQSGLKRLFLHAQELGFADGEGNRVSLKAPLPKDLQRVCQALGLEADGSD